MDVIFMNSKISKTSNPHRLLLNLTDKVSLKWSYKYVALSNLSIYSTWKNIKESYKKINLKYQFQRDIPNYFKCIFKKHEAVSDNPPIRIYVNQTENRIKFRIKTGCYFKLLTTETMKLLGSTKSRITKDENGENVPRLKIT